MKQQNRVKNIIEDVKGITLIALVITIIVLLILAGITISLTLGENGLLNRAEDAQIRADIEETKELIKLEIMGKTDEKGNYTNADVIKAVETITDKIVNQGEEIVISKKGNKVPISDLWKVNLVISFPKIWHYNPQEYVEISFKKGQVWTKEFLESIEDETELDRCNWNLSSDGLYIEPDAYSHIYITYNGVRIKEGEPLIPNAQYEVE